MVSTFSQKSMAIVFGAGLCPIAAAVLLSCSAAPVLSQEEIAINFEAFVGESEFACGESYEEIGTGSSTITPTDFRFYVSDVALIDEDGNAVPLELEQDGKWQHQNVALLDFEDGTDSCDNGTPETRTQVVGTIPEGDYESLSFTLGVPSQLNHNDAAIAPSPLNLTSMWWNWQGGYKFLRLDLETEQAIANVSDVTHSQTSHSQGAASNVQINQQTVTSHGNQTTRQTSQQTSIFQNGQGTHQQTSSTHTTHHGDKDGQHSQHGNKNASNNAYLIHLGSTGCADSAQSSLFNCANPNRVTVTLSDFDADKNVVVADLAELLAQSDLSTNQANTPNGCMSSPDDDDCLPILESLSLSSGTVGEQNLFFVE
ncbi:MAG: MbnP family copper-binding protein [Cyanobacteria bacterium P01_G01_bin.39]